MTARRAGLPRSSSATPTSLKATVAGAAGGKHALVTLTDGVTIEGRFAWPAQSTVFGPVLVCIRAESIVPVTSAGRNGANCFDAHVKSVNFLGAVVNCLLQIGSVNLRADLPARNPPDVGQTIMVRIDPEAVTLISEH